MPSGASNSKASLPICPSVRGLTQLYCMSCITLTATTLVEWAGLTAQHPIRSLRLGEPFQREHGSVFQAGANAPRKAFDFLRDSFSVSFQQATAAILAAAAKRTDTGVQDLARREGVLQNKAQARLFRRLLGRLGSSGTAHPRRPAPFFQHRS